MRRPLEALLERFLDERTAQLEALDPRLAPMGAAVARLVRAGGKRLRPAFVAWGYRAAGGTDVEPVLPAAAAVELLHTFALVHDDVMDRSATRRGQPAAHRVLADVHRADGHSGDPEWFGLGGAILAGDLAFVWADDLLDESALPPQALDRVRRVFSELRVEVTCGQFLDLWMAGAPEATDADAWKVALLKSARYTVTRPLQMGAMAMGDDPVLCAALARFGDAAGVAFQLRDDVLGLFGDPASTGKGAVEDLREGKRTLLVVRALQRVAPAQRGMLERLLGDRSLDEADAAWARDVIRDCGALEEVEALLAEQQTVARAALQAIPEPARSALGELADTAAYRRV